MITSNLAKTLQNKLLLLAVNNNNVEDICLLKYKWGGVDGLFHSYKHMVNVFGYKGTKDELSRLENNAVNELDNLISELFVCRGCNMDLRKIGLKVSVNSIMSKELFITNEGEVSKILNEQQNNNGQEIFRCKRCEKQLTNGDIIYVLLKNNISLNNNVIYDYYSGSGNIEKIARMRYYLDYRKINDKYIPQF